MGGTTGTDTFQAAGAAVGALAAYLAIVNGVAYLQDPLRARPRRVRRSRAAAPDAGSGAADVSADARRDRGIAVRRLVVQTVGLCVAACGADPFLVSYWYVYVLVGLAVVWAGGRFLRPAGVRPDVRLTALGGSRKVRVVATLAVAMVLLVLGVLLLITGGIYSAAPPDALVGPPGAAVPAQSLAGGFNTVGFICLALGAIAYRLARRLGSLEARRLLLRDTRPPVLYLRSFGDDRLKLRTATLGRPSLVERLSPRRFDRFEEVLVRHLSRTGPVVALNPPGTRLAPLGAARETLDSADWQSVIASWMGRAGAIVLVAPGQVTQGLRWELEAVSAHRYWDKTLVVVPPVSAGQLRRRWQAFLPALAGLWPFTCPPPADDMRALVLSFRGGQWTVITADRRTEWSYGAALSRSSYAPAGTRVAG